ncbi:MAG: hypothetical protein COV36_02230 [Alphaproteobacteria bacterium CG11_big_fil_rev_8_21_14_0_20_44_7]|nr:MAG: hypothetical protein COV36_02230 [Alphaproteobacteria bacterium CG11_big_fil_rev_8_21_14_0_20_44_7]
MSDKFKDLGIPASEITPSVSIAVSGLMEHLEFLNKELRRQGEQLQNLQNLIDTDTSPALPNIKSFEKRLEWAIAISKRHTEPTSVVIFRIENIEEIEERYGFQAGSMAINHAAKTLSDNIRDTDFFARISRDEFGALMFFADIENVQSKASRLCAQVAGEQLRWNNGYIEIHAGFGAHMIKAGDDSETALLAAKNAVFIEKQRKKFDVTNFKA